MKGIALAAECSPAPIRTIREARLEHIKELERQLAAGDIPGLLQALRKAGVL